MDTSKIKNIVVVGSGSMGHGIAQVFARKGFHVVVHDQSADALEKGKAAVEQELNFLISEKAITADVGELTLKNLNWTTELAVAVKDANYVVEAIVEDLKVKQSLFAELEKLCPDDTILASNTSGISISAIAEATSRPAKVIGMHWWNPPYLIPVIEIVKGSLTSQETLNVTKEITLKLDKKPVVVHKDIPGFLGNRMQYALMREAILMLEEGVASAEDIDLMVKAGFGFKFPVMGPLETIDMAGFDIYQNVSSYLYKHICNSVEPHRLIEEHIAKGEKGLKSGAGFYQYDQAELPKLQQVRTRKLLALLYEMGYEV